MKLQCARDDRDILHQKTDIQQYKWLLLSNWGISFTFPLTRCFFSISILNSYFIISLLIIVNIPPKLLKLVVWCFFVNIYFTIKTFDLSPILSKFLVLVYKLWQKKSTQRMRKRQYTAVKLISDLEITIILNLQLLYSFT